MKRCYGCMKLKTESPICEHCGYDENKVTDPHRLPAGTVLKEQYMVGRVLGQGGFGITYLGWDLYLDIPVAIKEYFPAGVVMRDTTVSLEVANCTGDEGARFRNNKERFLREAKMLARFSQVPQIVQVKNFFLTNNTAYIVMEYVEGITLKQYVQDNGGHLSADETFRILRPIVEALCKVHKAELVHRDISPDNIMMLPGGGAKLLDFGAVRDVGAAMAGKNLTRSTEAILKQGYAPIEQYQKRGGLGPWTDVYALCATMYFCLTGEVPPDAPERLLGYEELELRKKVPTLTKAQAEALEQGMALRAEERTPSMDKLYQALFPEKKEPAPVPKPAPAPKPKQEPAPKAAPKTEPKPAAKPAPKPAAKPANKPVEKKAPKKPGVKNKKKETENSRKILVAVLAAVAAVLLFLLVYTPVKEAYGGPGGSCGNDVTWKLNTETGELVIDGRGTMDNFRPEGEEISDREVAPWYEHREQITSITIGDSVINVGEYAFMGLENVTSVRIGAAVVRIGAYAFYGTALKDLTMPDTVTTIGMFAFGETKLTEVVLPNSLERLEDNTFYSCDYLKTITIGKTTTMSFDTWSGVYPFSCDDLGNLAGDLTIRGYKNTVASAYANALDINFESLGINVWEENGLCGDNLYYHLDLETGLMTISGEGPMWDFNGTWQNDRTGEDALDPNRTYAPWTEHRDQIKILSLGDGITYIGENAFENCAIVDVHWGEGVQALSFQSFLATQLDEVVLPESVTEIAPFAFNWCENLTYVRLPEGLKTIEEDVIADCVNLKEVHFGSGTKWERTDDTPFTANQNNTIYEDLTIYGLQNSDAEQLAKDHGYDFHIGARGLVAEKEGQCGDDAWWFLSGDTLVLYGDGATWKYNLSEEDISGWAKREYEAGKAFKGAPVFINYQAYIRNVVVLPGLEELSNGLLAGMYHVTSLDLGTLERFYAGMSYSNQLEKLELPETLKTLGGWAFNGCSNLKSVHVLGNTNIEESAFHGCFALQHMYFYGGREQLHARIFGNEGISSDAIYANVTFHARKYSGAETFAKKHGIPYDYLN